MKIRAKDVGSILIGFALYALFLALLIVFLGPEIKENFESHDYISRFNEYKRILTLEEEESYPIALYSIEGRAIANESIRKIFRDDEHLLLEALLDGPSEESIRCGLISYIDRETRLIGLSIEEGVAYVVLSKEFLNSKDLEKAKDQITETLRNTYDPLRVAIIVEGEII